VWEDVVINGNKKYVANSFAKGRVENPNANCLFNFSDPGIGKTTTLRLIVQEKKYRTFELNASDQRNKGIINMGVGYLMDSKENYRLWRSES
jgi:DNA polymerase III delta prime subunit